MEPDRQKIREVRRSTFSADSVRPFAYSGDLIASKYRIVELLGEGAMGVVFQARDEQLERDVAVKLIRPSVARKPEAQQRFLAEARAMARVRHVNAVPVFDFGWGAGSPFLVMEHVEGADLDAHLDMRGGPYPAAEAVALIEKICAGVAAIHEAGLVHRDLKPSNVLIGNDGRVMLTDFGVVGGLMPYESTGTPVGTPGFIAPEVIAMDFASGHPEIEVTAAADVYALGALAFELLTGEPAFRGSTVVEMLSNQLAGATTLPSAMLPALTSAFDAPLMAALDRNPATRTQTAEAFVRGIVDALRMAREPSYGRRIVVADGNVDARRRVQGWLEREFPDATVEAVEDGREALHGVNARSTALFVVDLDVPVVAAPQLVAMLRGHPRFDRVAIVVLADQLAPGQWASLRDKGADAVVLKPLDEATLLAVARAMIADPLRVRAARMD